jgi:hypothetical protein
MEQLKGIAFLENNVARFVFNVVPDIHKNIIDSDLTVVVEDDNMSVGSEYN